MLQTGDRPMPTPLYIVDAFAERPFQGNPAAICPLERPAVGVNEDPVCGSAHCCLGPFWAAKLNKSELVGFQCSSRGGIVGVRIARERVVLCGTAVTVLAGQFTA